MFQSDFRVVADLLVHRRTDPKYWPEPWVLKHAEATLLLLSWVAGDRRYEKVLHEEWEGGRPNTMDPYLDRLEEEGENNLAILLQKLYSLGRENEIKKVAYDEAFRKKLYKEFDLA